MKVTEWSFDRIKEAFEQVAKDEARKLRRIIAPAGHGGVTILVPALKQFPVGRLRLVGLWEKKGVTIGGAQSVEKNGWKQPNKLLVVQNEEEGRGWNARERSIIAFEELEGFLGPEGVDVDFRRILTEARDERGRKIFETCSSNDKSFLVAEWSRWDKYKRAPWRQDSSASASDGWRREVQEQLIVSWSP